MKKPMKADGRRAAEKPQGRIKGTGVNTKMVKEKVPQVVARTRVGVPTQTQKM